MDVDFVYFKPDLHIESTFGLQFTDSTLIHESNVDATLITNPLEFDILFHYIDVTYEVTDLIVPIGGIGEHLQKLEMYFRLGYSEDEWTEWHSLSDLRGLDDVEMKYISRYNPSKFSMFGNSIFQFVQLKIISKSVNYGKTLLTDLRVGVIYLGDNARSKKKAIKQVTDYNICEIPFNYLSRINWELTELQDAYNRQEHPADPCPNQIICDKTITHIYLHCSATKNNSEDPYWIKTIMDIWQDHTYNKRENGDLFGDIGYHWIIDPDGVIYEGRANAENGIRDETFHVCGSHVSQGNSCTLGICLLSSDGCFEFEDITENQYESLLKITSYFFYQNEINDASELASHRGFNLPRLSGHRDWEVVNGRYRICPGNNVYNNMQNIKSDIINILNDCTEFTDTYLDSISDNFDNCVGVSNTSQFDWDNDGIVDAEDYCWTPENVPWIDSDGDNIEDVCDNCPELPNQNQYDMDGDQIGDQCDPDLDGDGFNNDVDNCPEYYNSDQNPSACEVFPEDDSVACNDDDLITQFNAMKECVNSIINQLEIDEDNILNSLNHCLTPINESCPTCANYSILTSRMSFYTVGAHGNCRDYYSIGEYDSYYSCFINDICLSASYDNWNASMALPDSSSWDSYYGMRCICINNYGTNIMEARISAGIFALQCFNSFSVGYSNFCTNLKFGSIYTRSYWNKLISNYQSKLNRYQDRDCRAIHIPLVTSLPCP